MPESGVFNPECLVGDCVYHSGSPLEEEFGLIRPSLMRQLRSILDQYPDDGQILKVCADIDEEIRLTKNTPC